MMKNSCQYLDFAEGLTDEGFFFKNGMGSPWQPMKDELILDVAPICHFPQGLEIHSLNH